ncbi:uncharacterized protein EHS24_007299 [Apiotrichum porosum]|uniref:HpcH/HpaI aldolase/citrate lyase domain-containing protein n=1 Tax=Apiotrichum porosum TaxID=105984 RepID=A0A427XTW9_9TREE|nr:uncharacterized protein EHS24_007299 [Apiotrichum porosum]RSH82332.1 hypothetical protein EHS24_007299 [Apiotrichum porosum]
MTNAVYPTAHTTQVSNPRLRLLNQLKSGQKGVMTFMAIPSIDRADSQAVIIDCEHGHIGDDSMHNAVAAISALGVSPLIRVRATAPDLLKRALDTEAAQVVAYSKFPPQGLRGQGSAFPAIGHGLTTPEYMQSANQTILTIVQIETRQGVENVEEIAAVDGIDFLFIGPNDLAQSLLGYTPARGDEPVFVNAINRIEAAARRHGKWFGRLVNDGSLAKQAFKTFDAVAITGDTKAITNWYTAEIKEARS